MDRRLEGVVKEEEEEGVKEVTVLVLLLLLLVEVLDRVFILMSVLLILC